MMRMPTLADVAALAGVSKTAASKALLGGKGTTTKVGEETCARIRRAAAELQFVPNAAARNLTTNRTGFIAYVLADTIPDGFNDPYFNRYLAGVEEGCRKHGHGLYVARATLSDISQVVFPEKLRQRSVDGVIAVGEIPDAVFRELERYQLPVLFLNRNVDYERKYATFCADQFQCLRLAAEYAYALGHRNFCFCRLHEPESPTREKHDALKAELEGRLPGLRIVMPKLPPGGCREEGAVMDAFFAEWRGALDKPTFLFGSSKTLALLLGKLFALGLSCPGDVSALAVSDGELSRYFVPPLTTVDFDFEGIGMEAVGTMVAHIESGRQIPLALSRNDYPGRILERQSTRPINAEVVRP